MCPLLPEDHSKVNWQQRQCYYEVHGKPELTEDWKDEVIGKRSREWRSYSGHPCLGPISTSVLDCKALFGLAGVLGSIISNDLESQPSRYFHDFCYTRFWPGMQCILFHSLHLECLRGIWKKASSVDSLTCHLHHDLDAKSAVQAEIAYEEMRDASWRWSMFL